MGKQGYSVKEVATLAGVSIRTLHYYDKIGLLKPSHRAESGYRYYQEGELLRLQQILFYRELDFSLKEIGELLDDPDFDMIEALENHKLALKQRQKRIGHLLKTIKYTIDHLKNGTVMSKPEMLYEGLPEEFGGKYRQEAIDAYGEKAITDAEQELVKLGKAGFAALQQEMEATHRHLFTLQDEAPDSEVVQTAIAKHYAIIRQFWGTSRSEDKQAEAYAGLGSLYVSDGRYLKQDGKPQPDFALFMQQAMEHFAETRLK